MNYRSRLTIWLMVRASLTGKVGGRILCDSITRPQCRERDAQVEPDESTAQRPEPSAGTIGTLQRVDMNTGMKWDLHTLNATAIGVCVSRRTDIPALYGEWFSNSLDRGL